MCKLLNIKGQTLANVLLIGGADFKNDEVELTLFHNYLLIEFSSQVLLFESVDQNSRLRISNYSGSLPKICSEDEMKPFKISIMETVILDSLNDISVDCVHIYEMQEKGDNIVCAALCINLRDGTEFFIDPTYHFGIKVGRSDVKQKWLENYPNTPEKKLTFEII